MNKDCLKFNTKNKYPILPLMKALLAALLLVLLVLSCASRNEKKESTPSTETAEYWPTNAWQYDTLNQNSRFNLILDSFPGTYSVLIVNNGKIAFEHYQEPYAKDSLIHVNSCTKTVISMLFGTIFKEEYAEHENRSVVSYFPEYENITNAKQKIKVKHLLFMSSGLDWKGGIDASDVVKMSNTNDWAHYVFERSVLEPAGNSFHYNSGGSQVIASLLHKQTKNGLLAFAKSALFNPLGITHYKWDSTPKGIPKAGWGLHLKMDDLAKLGLLLLNDGEWDEDQLIPKQWVRQISNNHITANTEYDYGYQCWIPKNMGTECYLFRGSYPPSTKIVAVLPELNSVVVYVGENYETNKLLRDFVIPALK